MYLVTYYDYEMEAWFVETFYTFELAESFYEICKQSLVISDVRISKEVNL